MKANILFCLILAFVLLAIGCEKKPAETEGALLQAAKIGDIDRVRSLISSGVDVNITDQKGNTPLLLALQGGYRDVAILLVAKGADVNVKSPPQKYAVGRSRPGDMPLHYAARSGFKHVAELLIAKGADVNARSTPGS